MKILAAILAGGQSRRFGSDKTQAVHHGRTLLDHVIAALAAETPHLVIVGRAHPGLPTIPDRPGPGLGPLGGLAAALHYAAANGFSQVLAAGCDLPQLPHGLAAALGPAPAHARGQPTLGLWPAELAAALDAHVAAGHRSLHGWATACGARSVDLGPLPNINTPDDLAALS